MTAYRVRVVIGGPAGLDFTVTNTDPEPDPTEPQVLDGLTIGWRFGGDLHPGDVDPVEATLAIYADQVADASALTLGATILVQVTDPAQTTTIAELCGRVAELTAAPVRRKDGPRLVYTVRAVDYTVDLAEARLPAATYTARTVGSAIDRVVIDLFNTDQPLPQDITESVSFVDLSAATVAAYEVPEGDNASIRLRAFLALLADDTTLGLDPEYQTWERRFLVAMGDAVDGTPKAAGTYLSYTGTVGAHALLPGRLTLGGDGIVRLTFPDGGDRVLSGARAPLAALAWRQGKDQGPTRVTVKSPQDPPVYAAQTAENTAATYKAAVTVDADVSNAADALALAAMYVTGPDDSDSLWNADKLQYVAGDTITHLFGLFPPQAEGVQLWNYFAEVPVVVPDLHPGIDLVGVGGHYAGLLDGADLTISGGRVVLDFRIRRTLPRHRPPDNAGHATYTPTFSGLRADLPTGPSFSAVESGLTFYELRLIRRD